MHIKSKKMHIKSKKKVQLKSFSEDLIIYQPRLWPDELLKLLRSTYIFVGVRQLVPKYCKKKCFLCLQKCNCQAICACGYNCDVIKQFTQKFMFSLYLHLRKHICNVNIGVQCF